MAEWSIWMLEYAHCLRQPLGAIKFGAWNGGTRYFPYSYIYLEGEGHRILVDVGFDATTFGAELAANSGVIDWRDADHVLRKIGVAPDDIDTVLLTHAHYDHMGNLSKFPNAQVYVQRREIERWQAAIALGARFAVLMAALDPADIFYAIRLADQGRLHLVDGERSSLMPGIDLVPAFGTHTEGSQFIVVRNRADTWVATGDNLFSYENVEDASTDTRPKSVYTPIGFGSGGIWQNLVAIDAMLAIAGRLDRLLIVHEGETYRRFPAWRSPEDGLWVAELRLAPNVTSRLPELREENSSQE